MSKNNNKHYLALNALWVVMVSYCYYLMKKQEEYNNIYSYPFNTITNWTPVTLSSFMLFLTSTTSLVLSLNPGRSNYNEGKLQKTLDAITMATPGLLSVAIEGGFKVAKLIAGERAEAAEAITEAVASYSLEALRFLVIAERIHAHQIARSFEVLANPETGEAGGRYLSRIAATAHYFDKGFILITESIKVGLWRTGLYKFLTKWFDLDDKDTLKTLAALDFFTDIMQLVGTKSINNIALAAEIIIYGEDKTQYYKIEDSKVMQLIKSFAHKISEGIKAAQEELEHLRVKLVETAEEIKTKILEIADLNNLKEAAERLKDDAIDALNALQEHFKNLQDQFNKKVKEISATLELFEHHFGDKLKEMHKSAIKIQSRVRGRLERLKDKKDLIEVANSASKQACKSDNKDIVTNTEIAITPFMQNIDLVSQTKTEPEKHNKSFGSFLNRGIKSIGNALHIPSHNNGDTSKQPKDNKANSSNKQGSASGSGNTAKGSEIKSDKADLEAKDININDYSYLNYVIKKIAEFLPILSLSTSSLKEKMTIVKNKEKEEYEKEKIEAEKNANNNIVSIKYESLPILEKPINKTQTSYHKSGQEIMEMALVLESSSISMFGEDDGFYNQGAIIQM